MFDKQKLHIPYCNVSYVDMDKLVFQMMFTNIATKGIAANCSENAIEDAWNCRLTCQASTKKNEFKEVSWTASKSVQEKVLENRHC